MKNTAKWFSSLTQPTSYQLDSIVEILMEQYDDVSVGEIDLFFKMLVKGEFGPVTIA